MLEVIATERLKSRSSSGAVTAWIDSRVGADQVAEPVRDPRQGAAVAAVGEQLVGAERAGGDDHAACAVSVCAPLAEPGAGALAA